MLEKFWKSFTSSVEKVAKEINKILQITFLFIVAEAVFSLLLELDLEYNTKGLVNTLKGVAEALLAFSTTVTLVQYFFLKDEEKKYFDGFQKSIENIQNLPKIISFNLKVFSMLISSIPKGKFSQTFKELFFAGVTFPKSFNEEKALEESRDASQNLDDEIKWFLLSFFSFSILASALLFVLENLLSPIGKIISPFVYYGFLFPTLTLLYYNFYVDCSDKDKVKK